MKSKISDNEKQKYMTEDTRSEIPSFNCTPRSIEEYRVLLPENVFKIMFQDGTEPAFSNQLNDNKAEGIYYCGACRQPLFGSEAKFNSGTGWPSFFAPLTASCLDYEVDYNIGVPRTAVLCSCCHGHLGHVFTDGPKPTYLRFCMNGTALLFNK